MSYDQTNWFLRYELIVILFQNWSQSSTRVKKVREALRVAPAVSLVQLLPTMTPLEGHPRPMERSARLQSCSDPLTTFTTFRSVPAF